MLVVVAGGLLGVAVALPGGATDAVVLEFQSIACPSMGSVPANRLLGDGTTTLDDTGGAYLGWSATPVGHPVAAFDESSLPAGCQALAGARFRLSASPQGAHLRPGSGEFVPVGAEDGAVTTLAVQTGPTGSSELLAADLPPAQQAALATPGSDGGLWVSAALPGDPWSFGNLSCHYDHVNADNLEVLRPSGASRATCVLFLVGPASGGEVSGPVVGVPFPTTPPTTTPAPAPTSPGPGAPPPGAPLPTNPPEGPPAGGTPPSPSPTPPPPPPSGLVGPTPTTEAPADTVGRTPGGDLVGGTTTSSAAPPATPATPATSPAGPTSGEAGASTTTSAAAMPPLVVGPSTTPTTGVASAEELAAPLPTSLRLVVRVGGVLPRPPGEGKLVAALRCGPEEVAVRLDPSRPPAGERSARLVLASGPARCTAAVTSAPRARPAGATGSSIAPGDAPSVPRLVEVNGTPLADGTLFAFWPEAGQADDVLVEVTYGAVPELPAAAPPSSAAAGPSAWVTAGLAALFAAGLAGSIWASRRTTAVGPQEA